MSPLRLIVAMFIIVGQRRSYLVEIWFEAVPSPAGADAERVRADAERIRRATQAGATRILVPEVADTGFEAVDPIRFGAQVAAATGTPVGVALVTAQRSPEEVAARILLADSHGVDTLLIVGPASRAASPAGPSVTETLDAHGRGRNLGVVTIPTRRRDDLDEPQRVLRKQRAGARFAVSQILFEAETALALRRDYLAGLSPGEAPIPFYYSIAPVVRKRDLRFLETLGVAIPKEVRARIEAAKGPQRAQVAQELVLDVVRSLVQHHTHQGLGPFGFCISHVMHDNVDAAVALLEAVGEAATITA